QTSGSGISILLAVATIFTGSGNLYRQWELLTWQWECLVHFIPNTVLSLVITVCTSAMTNSQRSCLRTVSLTVLLPCITLKLVGKWKSPIVV
nr:hypothetical protein [Tanacetum cinerariifolium]